MLTEPACPGPSQSRVVRLHYSNTCSLILWLCSSSHCHTPTPVSYIFFSYLTQTFRSIHGTPLLVRVKFSAYNVARVSDLRYVDEERDQEREIKKERSRKRDQESTMLRGDSVTRRVEQSCTCDLTAVPGRICVKLPDSSKLHFLPCVEHFCPNGAYICEVAWSTNEDSWRVL